MLRSLHCHLHGGGEMRDFFSLRKQKVFFLLRLVGDRENLERADSYKVANDSWKEANELWRKANGLTAKQIISTKAFVSESRKDTDRVWVSRCCPTCV